MVMGVVLSSTAGYKIDPRKNLKKNKGGSIELRIDKVLEVLQAASAKSCKEASIG